MKWFTRIAVPSECIFVNSTMYLIFLAAGDPPVPLKESVISSGIVNRSAGREASSLYNSRTYINCDKADSALSLYLIVKLHSTGNEYMVFISNMLYLIFLICIVTPGVRIRFPSRSGCVATRKRMALWRYYTITNCTLYVLKADTALSICLIV